MLSWQPNPNDPEVFHITHVDNLPSIIAHGLHCDATVARSTTAPVAIGSAAIKARRLTWQLNLPQRACVGEFTPFYFCPRSVMLFQIYQGHAAWSRGQSEVVHLVSRVARLSSLGGRTVFTDRNAATAYHYASEDLSEMPSRVDWSAMPLTHWAGTPKEPRQAEFLVESVVPWSAFERIVAMDSTVAARATAALRGASTPLVHVDRSWYY